MPRIEKNLDKKTASAFATSWNNLPIATVYTYEQFTDWMSPLGRGDIEGKEVLEMGCGNASLMYHMASWSPSYLLGIDLGDSVKSAARVMRQSGFKNWEIKQDDLVTFDEKKFDVVYCIGVLHHLGDPERGFRSVVNSVKSGGRFHCWVYAREGNAAVRYLVDPMRKVCSKLPWYITKYMIALPFAALFYIYAKAVSVLQNQSFVKKLPMFSYCLWIAKREPAFFAHMVFDQLVTPQTAYIEKKAVEGWLGRCRDIEGEDAYIVMRNGNSWKFGGKKR